MSKCFAAHLFTANKTTMVIIKASYHSPRGLRLVLSKTSARYGGFFLVWRTIIRAKYLDVDGLFFGMVHGPHLSVETFTKSSTSIFKAGVRHEVHNG
jgi:hypothetical protein